MGIFGQFLEIGFSHILEGYDHLLFLIGLTIISRDMRSLLKVISAFTVAHSTTLVLSALGILSLQPVITEALIALSIVYVGVENIVKWNKADNDALVVKDRRWIVAGSFGLIHGAGFSGHLTDLLKSMLGMGNIWSPLMGFNLGIELGQITMIIVLFPLMWYARKLKKENLLVPELSRVIAAVGGVLLVSRVWGL
jgi:hydrogenase/urease accessory protein HupE